MCGDDTMWVQQTRHSPPPTKICSNVSSSIQWSRLPCGLIRSLTDLDLHYRLAHMSVVETHCRMSSTPSPILIPVIVMTTPTPHDAIRGSLSAEIDISPSSSGPFHHDLRVRRARFRIDLSSLWLLDLWSRRAYHRLN